MNEQKQKTDAFVLLIQDTQETIRFIETKLGFVTLVISGITGFFIKEVDIYLKDFITKGFLYQLILILCIILMIISYVLIYLCIKPIKNPKKNLPNKYQDYPNLFLGRNRKGKLIIDTCYSDSFINVRNINKSLELEYLKLSFIRNRKLKYFNYAIIGVLLSFVLNILCYVSLKQIHTHVSIQA